MKLLLDENLSHRLVSRLASTFPGTAHVDAVGLRGEPDSAIWEYAARHDFVLVSKEEGLGDPEVIAWHGSAATGELNMGSPVRVAGRNPHPLSAAVARSPAPAVAALTSR